MSINKTPDGNLFDYLKPFDKEAHFVKATGSVEDLGGLKKEIGKGPEAEIGEFGTNNGVLAFVDENQDYWVGRPTTEAVQALEEAGYKKGEVYVPHSSINTGILDTIDQKH